MRNNCVKSNFKIKGNDNPSPFLVDLNKEINKKATNNNCSLFYGFLDSFNKFDLKSAFLNYLKLTKNNIDSFFKVFNVVNSTKKTVTINHESVRSHDLSLAFHKNNQFSLNSFFLWLFSYLKNNEKIRRLIFIRMAFFVAHLILKFTKFFTLLAYRLYIGVSFIFRFFFFFFYFLIKRISANIFSWGESLFLIKEDVDFVKNVIHKKRIEIDRVEFLKEQKKLEAMELRNKNRRIKENIKTERCKFFFINLKDSLLDFVSGFFSIFPRFSLRALRSSLLFGIFLFLVAVLPFKGVVYFNSIKDLQGSVLGVTESAIDEIKNAAYLTKNKNFNEAGFNFSKAGESFEEAKSQINEVDDYFSILEKLIPINKIKLASNADSILSCGILSSQIAKNITEIGDYFSNQSAFVLADFYGYASPRIDNIADLTAKFQVEINKIEPDSIPSEYRNYFLTIQKNIGNVNSKVLEIDEWFDAAGILLGMEYDKRYLLVFQNNAEMRASGGFIGSFAVADVANGKIKNIQVPGGGSYDTEAGLYERIIAPLPLHLVNPLWHFWDSNWWPDWTLSARKLEWFYEKSDGSTVDGVISFTPTVMERLLDVIGPIDLTDKYGVVIDSNNFWIITQTYSEQKQDVTNKPKMIIGDLMNEIIKEIPERLNKEMLLKIVEATESSLKEKHVLIYSHDDEVQMKMSEYDFAGEIKNPDGDFLMVVNTNIAGGKSDKDISEEITHESEIMDDGSIVNKVTVKRTHNALRGKQFTGVRNVDWMRIYVPEGSQLISAEGFSIPDKKYFEEPSEKWTPDSFVMSDEGRATVDMYTKTKIYNESGKTVFANWTQLDPEQTIEVVVKYKLPFTVDDFVRNISDKLGKSDFNFLPYSFLAQKQPGSIGSKISSTIKYNNKYNVLWTSSPDLLVENKQIGMEDILNTDRYYSVLLEY